jgi:hypothetical protein
MCENRTGYGDDARALIKREVSTFRANQALGRWHTKSRGFRESLDSGSGDK